LERQALALAKDGDYDAATHLLTKQLPDEFSELLSERAKLAAERLRGEADAKFAAGIAAAEKHSQGGQLAAALSELDKLTATKYASRAAAAAELRKRLADEIENTPEARQKRQLAQAHESFAKLLLDIRTAVDGGDLARAAQLGQAALANETLQSLAARVQRVAAVTKLMPEIPERKKIWPLKTLRELQGKEVALETSKGAKNGTVRKVTDERITLVRTWSINNQLHEREEEVPIADLLPAAREKYKLDWTPQTDEESAAASIIAAGGEGAADQTERAHER
jgi:hypothetical protein